METHTLHLLVLTPVHTPAIASPANLLARSAELQSTDELNNLPVVNADLMSGESLISESLGA